MASIAEKIILYLIKHPPASAEDINVAKRRILRIASPSFQEGVGRVAEAPTPPGPFGAAPSRAEGDVLATSLRQSKGGGPIIPSSSDLIKSYHELRKKNKIKDNPALLNLLVKRSVRTLSGVAVVTVLTKPFTCPGECVYCPNEKNMPKSYISDEPAAARALALHFDPYEQVARRLQTLRDNGHPTDKVELIVKGGSWNAYPLDYQYWFITECFRAANQSVIPSAARGISIQSRAIPRLGGVGPLRRSVSEARVGETIAWPTVGQPTPGLEAFPALAGSIRESLGMTERARLLHAQTKNETAKHRIIGLTLETRPDAINEENIKIMRELGCTRVELGTQTVDDKILKLVKRGHDANEIKRATKLLKNYGFKVDYHLMPQLPGSTPKKDLEMLLEIFKNPNYRPDMIKIYPCTTVKGTKLFDWLKKGKYKPYTTRALVNILKIFKTKIPRYARVSRLIRDIPSQHIKAGNTITNLRQVIQKEMAEEGTKCRCLRCREVGHFPLSKGERKGLPARALPKAWQAGVCRPLRSSPPKLFVERYTASDGVEYFLSYEDKKRECVFAFCRLRLNNETMKQLNNETYPAFVRELHTYGQMLEIGTKGKKDSQHRGLGRKLMDEVEKICKKNKIDRLAVISGIGVRDYYRKLDYKLENGYMVKKLK